MLFVSVPATSANLGPGFDVLGLALSPRNRFRIRPAASDSFVAHGAPGLGGELFFTAFERLVPDRPALAVQVEIGIPPSRGLGSSASAVVAALVAAREMGAKASDQELLRLATELEGHPDNVVPALLGGFTLALSTETEILYQRLDWPVEPGLVLAIPEFELPTAAARAAVPSFVPRGDAVYNVGRVSLLTSALLTGQLHWLGHALEDRLHQPYREALVPGMRAVSVAAKEAGAWGVTLSGAGPSLLAWCPPERRASVAHAMDSTWQALGVRCKTDVTALSPQGATAEKEA